MNKHTFNTYLYSKSRGWWQCGMWVNDKSEATKYRDEKEAELVAALRNLPADIEIVVG